MKPPPNDPRNLVARTVLGGGSDVVLSVVSEFKKDNDTWTVFLRRGGNGSSGSRRRCMAVARLCELDSTIEFTLRSGRTVRRVVHLNPRPIDGPHAATEQILPLLLPIKVNDDLYAYQRQGVAWLLRHKRALLGDDMGLGKTAQALAGARRLIRNGHVAWSLIVAPRTLIANWVAEAKHWAPELTIATALPLGADREAQWNRLVRRAHLLLTSYEQLREPAKALIRNPPDLVIADEAHRLRNIGSQSTKGFRSLRTTRFWALTGTPIERDAEDLTVLLSLLDSARFSPADKSLPTASLRARIRPYILRRSKADVLKELPTVIEEKEILELTEEQKSAYRSAIRNHIKNATRAGFLPLFNRLRMLCDVDPCTGASSKLDRAVELIGDIDKLGEKAVVFSYILEPLNWLERRFKEAHASINYSVVTGEMTLEQRALALDNFKSNAACSVLLASTRVASEGLTLTEANHVIFINQWWNPSSNSQARDRVVRIGQSRVVSVKSFTCRGTVEERLERLLKEKSLTFNELVEALNESAKEIDTLDLFGQYG